MSSTYITDIKKKSFSNESLEMLDLLKDKYHYNFSGNAIATFERRIQNAVKESGFQTISELTQKLKTTPSYLQNFISSITVNVTEMFREPSCWKYVRSTVIPNLLKENESINIWHAGCSSGEEVFSTAIILQELGIAHKVQILATDIDLNILNVAKSGMIKKSNFDLYNKNYILSGGNKSSLSFYTTFEDTHYTLHPEILKKTVFQQHNLTSKNTIGKFDLIFCRNVLIYFENALQNHLLQTFYNSANENARLIIGMNELLICLENSPLFLMENYEEKTYFKRPFSLPLQVKKDL